MTVFEFAKMSFLNLFEAPQSFLVDLLILCPASNYSESKIESFLT